MEGGGLGGGRYSNRCSNSPGRLAGRCRARSVRPPPRRLGLLPAVRRLAPAHAGRAGRRAGDGHPRADRPRRHLRRGEVRPGLPGRRGSGRCSASTSPTGPQPTSGDRRRPTRPATPVRGGASATPAGAAAAAGDVPGRRGTRADGPAGRRCAGWSRRPTCAGERGQPGGSTSPTWPTSSPSSSRPATCWCCSARAPSWAGRRPGAATTSPWPRSRRGGRWCRRTNLLVELVSHRLPGRARRLGSRHHPARRPDGRDRPAGRARRGAHQRGPLRRPPRRRRPSTSSTPPAGWSRSTGATSTAATPRGSSSPASRWQEIAEEICRLAGLAGDPDARGPAAARPHPRGRRPVRPRPARRPRAGRGALPGVRAALGLDQCDDRRHDRRLAAGALRGRDRRPLRLGAAAA